MKFIIMQMDKSQYWQINQNQNFPALKLPKLHRPSLWAKTQLRAKLCFHILKFRAALLHQSLE